MYNVYWRRAVLLTLNSHLSKTVKAFDLIPRLRARPKYQLSSGTLPYKLALIFVCLRFLSSSTNFGYAQPW